LLSFSLTLALSLRERGQIPFSNGRRVRDEGSLF